MVFRILSIGFSYLNLGQLKIFKIAAAKRGRFVIERFISGRTHETSLKRVIKV